MPITDVLVKLYHQDDNSSKSCCENAKNMIKCETGEGFFYFPDELSNLLSRNGVTTGKKHENTHLCAALLTGRWHRSCRRVILFGRSANKTRTMMQLTEVRVASETQRLFFLAKWKFVVFPTADDDLRSAGLLRCVCIQCM